MTRRTPSTARASNIAAHYDLSNDLFAAFLDPTMTYSWAWFDDSEPVEAATRLEEAQLRKIDGILDLAGVRRPAPAAGDRHRMGALAIRAAQRGARVTTITLSREQMRLARERVEAAGLSGLVDVRVQDYREVEGEYDAIVSVEMIEAVGEAYWPTYFAALDRLLAPGGRVAIQAITMDHERFLATRRSFSWIQKYIFPGGIIPSLQAVDDALAAHTTLRVTRQRELRPHYARTLRLWRERFLDQWPHIHAQGFDETFRRMWEFYLAYSEAGFRSGYLGVSQLQLTREAGMKLNGKVAWVVGGSSGIGAAVARELVRRGATVAISARREEQLHDVRPGTCSSSPPTSPTPPPSRPLQHESGRSWARSTSRCCRPATGSRWTRRTGTPSVFDQHIRVNLTGMSNAIAAVLPGMLRRRSGTIAGIASVAGYRGLAGAEAYGATKAAQINLLESLRVHLARTGVHVTTVCPGFVRTDLTAGNRFPMPFIIEADQAARSICDGLERERTEIVFPARMALLMKAARLVPARAWTALWARTSLT